MMIGYAVVLFDQNTPVPGYYALMPTVGTVLIILFSHNSWVGRLIGNRLFVGVGLVSYSAYLWHQPLFAYLRIYRFGDTKVGQYASAILITFLLAYLTWRFIERPFRDRSVVQWRRALAVFLVVGVGLVGFGVAGVASNGFEAVYEARLTLQERLFLQNAKELSELRNQPHDVQQGSTCLLSYEEKDSFHQRFKECVTEYGPAAAIMGDSHASNMKSALLSTERYPFVVWIGGWHCHPYHHSIKDLESGCDFDQIAAFLQQEAPNFSVLLYNQLGSYFILDEAGDTLNHKSVEFAQSGKMEVAKDKIGYILSYLEPISQQIPVVWLASWIEPRYPMHQPRKMIGYGIEGLDYIPDVVDMFVQVDRVVKEKMALLNSSVRYVELYDPVAGRNFIELFEGDCVAFNDKDHLSRCGERIAGPIFDRKIRQALQSVQ